MIVNAERPLAYGTAEQALCERRAAADTITTDKVVILQDKLDFLPLLLSHISRVVISYFYPQVLRNLYAGRLPVGRYRSAALRWCFPKPNGNPQIIFDGETIRIDGFEPDRDPVVQAKAQASWLRELLVDSTGREFGVRSAIVFPGWFVNYTGPKERTVWVLNPKALPTFLDHEPQRLSEDDIHLASFHLSRFVRATAQ